MERDLLPAKQVGNLPSPRAVGVQPLAALFARVAKPIGTEATPGARLAGRRLVVIDGRCLDAADTRSTPSTSLDRV